MMLTAPARSGSSLGSIKTSGRQLVVHRQGDGGEICSALRRLLVNGDSADFTRYRRVEQPFGSPGTLLRQELIPRCA